MALTDTKLKNLKPGDKAYQESDGGGLFVEVMPGGSKGLAYPLPPCREAGEADPWRVPRLFAGRSPAMARGLYDAGASVAYRRWP
jgi:hypothetical protein